MFWFMMFCRVMLCLDGVVSTFGLVVKKNEEEKRGILIWKCCYVELSLCGIVAIWDCRYVELSS